MSEPARQPPKRATRGSRTGWAWMNVKIPWQLKRQLAAAAAAAGGSIYNAAVAAIGERVKAGDPIPEFMLSRKAPP